MKTTRPSAHFDPYMYSKYLSAEKLSLPNPNPNPNIPF